MGFATIKIEGENAFIRVDEREARVCPDGDVKIIVPVGVQGAPGADAAGSILLSVVNGTTYAISPGKLLDKIAVIPSSGDRILTVGYSAGTGEIIDNEEISSNNGTTFPIVRYFHGGQTIHFSGFTGQVKLFLQS